MYDEIRDQYGGLKSFIVETVSARLEWIDLVVKFGASLEELSIRGLFSGEFPRTPLVNLKKFVMFVYGSQ